MNNRKFLGFYPNKSIWVGARPTLDKKCIDFLPRIYGEIVYSKQSRLFDIMVCRDGMVLLSLKMNNTNVGIYLDYINAFYVVFESVISQIKFQKFFDLEEISIKDYIYCEYGGDNRLMSARIDNLNSRTKYIYETRNLEGYVSIDFGKIDIRNNVFWQDLLHYSIVNDPRNQVRDNRILLVDEIDRVASEFEKVCESWEHISLLSKLTRVVEDINLGNYTHAISYSWLIIEVYLNKLYYTNRLGGNSDDSRIGVLDIINSLRDKKLLPTEVTKEIHLLRKTRNEIIHRGLNKSTFEKSALAIEIIREFIRKDIAVDIKILF